MDKTKIGVIAATAILGLGALGGAAVKASASSSPVKSTTPSVAAAVEAPAGATDADNVQQGDQTSPDATAATLTSAESAAEPGAGLPDTDNVQSGDQAGGYVQQGDQTTPDVAGATGI